MYDIYFDLNNMHQTVEESDKVDPDDEFWALGEQFSLDFLDELDGPPDDYPVIVKKSKTKSKGNGCVCPKCGELYPYAEPNQPDGSFKCWSCRNF